ncbi:hypothetical protein HK100_011058 [Physocladia obscura]|uniref:Uncharacterized protein n=1 Tax=Physocladia obscura TaxID=109957 RepID=A0AAD5XGW1_9FUNG|nr:hypothetical protein HK100_011058 [Physocladia obscura]
MQQYQNLLTLQQPPQQQQQQQQLQQQQQQQQQPPQQQQQLQIQQQQQQQQHQLQQQQQQQQQIQNQNQNNQQILIDADAFSAAHREVLRAQIQAFKLLSQNLPISADLASALFADEDVSDPSGDLPVIDPVAIIQERERRIQARINYRIRLLESLPANLSNSDSPLSQSSTKLRVLIELKSLKLAQKQRQLRESIFLGTQHNSTLLTSIDRSLYRRVRKFSLREARQTEQVEAERRGERERREKMRLAEYLSAVVQCGRELTTLSKNTTQKYQRLGASVIKYHAFIEKEEQKRSQRVSAERLKALKENDEAAYIKLLDEAKDGRIMQILSKTNAYLANLASAVVTQKDHISSQDAIYLEGADVVIPDEDEPGSNTDYYAVAHRIKEKVEKQSSLLVGGQLKEYQIKGLEWMISLYNNRLNGILADEMGLGKTIQTISLITYLIEKKKQMGPYLVIIPLATVTNWTHEFEKWAPSVSKIVFKGGPEERRRTAAQIRAGNFQVLITTYEYIIREKAVLAKIKWVYMIIDEGHRMKNAQSKLSTTLMQFYNTRYRVILTGTPLQNNLSELWAILNFVLPKIFNSVKSFDEWFSSPFGATGNAVQLELNEEERLLMIKGLHKVLRPFLLRRLKKDVEKELPDKIETIIKCPMSALQRKITDRVKKLRSVGPFDQTKLSGTKALNNLVMQFRKICNHPFVFPEVEQLVLPNETMTSDMIYRVSGKFELLDRILPKYFKTGHRVLMFFQMTQIMDIAEDFFRHRGIKFLRLDGAVKGEDREHLLKTFNAPDSEFDIFILSTRAGGLGLNLQTADTVVIFDSDWNPHQDLQAQDRAHRIGQKKEVRILRLITSNSIEEHILAKAQQKLDLDGKVIQAGKFDQKTSEKEREELLRVLFEAEKDEKGNGEDGNEDSEEMTDEQLNEVLARSPEEIETFAQIDREREARELEIYNGHPPPRLISEKELPPCYQIDFTKLKAAEADDLLSIKPRDRKANLSQVHYGDVLTEEQFLMAADSGTLHEAIAEKLEQKARRKASKLGAGETGALADDDGSGNENDDGEHGPFDDFEEDEEGEEAKSRRIATKLSIVAVDSGGGSSKKRGKKSKAEMLASDSISITEREFLTTVSHACLAAIRGSTYEDEKGKTHSRAEAFEILPPKRTYKDYHEIIKLPICLKDIQQKINSHRYVSFDEIKADFALLFGNARTYNVEGSDLYEDSIELEQIFNETLESYLFSKGNRSSQKHGRDDDEEDTGGVFGNVDMPRFKLKMKGEHESNFNNEVQTPLRRPAKRVKDDSEEEIE